MAARKHFRIKTQSNTTRYIMLNRGITMGWQAPISVKLTLVSLNEILDISQLVKCVGWFSALAESRHQSRMYSGPVNLGVNLCAPAWARMNTPFQNAHGVGCDGID